MQQKIKMVPALALKDTTVLTQMILVLPDQHVQYALLVIHLAKLAYQTVQAVV